MKKLLATAAIIGFATTAQAETRYANITNVQPNYQTVYRNIPQQQCNDVEVPIYGTVQGQASTGDALAGAIIGGVIGNQFGGGSGKDAATVLGAIVGADMANKKGSSRQVITGYRVERQCGEVMIREQQREIKNYTITYRWKGVTGQSYTYNRYSVGDRIPVTISINAN